MENESEPFDWGEAVQVSQSPIKEYRQGELGSICGFRRIQTSQEAEEYGIATGSVLCLVEFEDGKAIEIPAYLLSRSVQR